MRKATENGDGTFLLLENGRNEYCLWPADVPVPRGWAPILTTGDRKEFIDSVLAEVPGIRPVTFVKSAS